MSPISGFSNLQNNVNATLLSTTESISQSASELRNSEHMSAGKKLFLSIITFGIAGHLIDKHERNKDERLLKQCAQDVIALKSKLEGLQENTDQVFSARIGDTEAEIHQSDLNTISCRIENQNVVSPFTAKKLVEHIENDMANNIDFYGKNAVCNLLEAKRDPATDIGTGPSRDRELCLKVMNNLVGMEEHEFNNTPTSLLHTFTLNALHAKNADPESLRSFQADMANAHHIASEDAQSLLNDLSDAMRTNRAEVQGKVNIDALRAPVGTAIAGGGQGNDHVTTWHEVHNFAADLVCNEDLQVYDANVDTPGQRIKDTFSDHAETITDIIKHPALINTLPDELRNPISDAITQLTDGVRNFTGQNLDLLNADLLRMAVSHIPAETLADCEIQIDTFAQQAATQIQETVTEQFSQIFGAGEPEQAPAQALDAAHEPAVVDDVEGGDAAPAEDAAPAQEKTPIEDYTQGTYVPPSRKEKTSTHLEYEAKILDSMLQESSGANSGQGKFMSAVFSKYFKDISSMDQRNMIAASIRYATAADSPGTQLGAMLKGAGPIMQKMLQGFNTTDMDPEMKTALGDMKDSLASIHPKVVTAHLLDMVEKSHGEITNITVNRSLGAASVGQAFLCTMSLRDGSEKECVVKILRPDVQNRAFREKALFTEASKQIPGMEVTFNGQLNRIMEELDLRLEAKNVEAGAIYDGALACDALESMKLSPLVEPTANTMVIEKAPGTTLAGYIRDMQGKIEAITADPVDGGALDVILEKKQALEDLYVDIKERQRHLSSLSAAWVEEGIFGKGFYHGDLHAGNIMTDADKMTVIDFGNATSLTKEQQGSVMRMMAGASVGHSKIFLKAYEELLSPNGKEIFKDNKDVITQTVSDIMSLGGTSQTGQRIGVILTRLQNLGLELPAPIYNFSQCQLRLQGALEGVNSLMKQANDAMDNVGSTLPANGAVPMYYLSSNLLMYVNGKYKPEVVQDAITQRRDAVEADCDQFKQLLSLALPDGLHSLLRDIPPQHATLRQLVEDCSRSAQDDNVENFNSKITTAYKELVKINKEEINTIEAAIANFSAKVPPHDFCHCMSDVISNHMHTVINQVGLRDSIRLQWLSV